MRGATLLCLVSLLGLTLTSTFALNPRKGRILSGPYNALGRSIAAGVQIRYQQSRVSISPRGQIRGRVWRAVYNRGRLVSRTQVRIGGGATALSVRGRTFRAPARFRLGDGAVVRGQFSGLTPRDQRLSRFFRGKVVGVRNSTFTLRSR